MVNHIYTLLMNKRAEDAPEGHLFIDPSYIPAPATCAGMKAVDLLLSAIPGDRHVSVMALLPYIHLPDLCKYRGMFDSRVTYDLRRGYDIVEFADMAKYSGMLEGVPSAVGKAGLEVFRPTGRAGFDKTVEELHSIYSKSFEHPLKTGALLFAAAMHIDTEASYGKL